MYDSSVLPTLVIAIAFVLAGGLVTLWTMDWHVKPPHWDEDAKVGISVLGGVTLAPAFAMAGVIAMLTAIPILLIAPFMAGAEARLLVGHGPARVHSTG